MTKAGIIGRMGCERYVERIVGSFMHAPRLSPALQDLSQIVYEALLNTDADRIVKLWRSTDTRGQREIDFYIVGILRGQTEGTGTCWRSTYQGYTHRALPRIDDVATSPEP